MKPVMQTVFGEGGNCFSANLASLMELPIDAVPNFFDQGGDSDAGWWKAVRAWLRARQLGIVCLTATSVDDLQHYEGYYLVAGISPRGIRHCVIYRDGVLVHDPHPTGGGLDVLEYVDLLYPTWDAANPSPQPEPNGLVRAHIDGEHCVGHGPGTWDYITGEFS